MNNRYRLVEGLPSAVEQEVNELLNSNKWVTNGSPFPRLNAEGVHLVVQPMERLATDTVTLSRVGKEDEVIDVSPN